MKNDIRTEGGRNGPDQVIPAQAGFYALRHNEFRFQVVPVIAWLVAASGRLDVLTPEGRAEYEALEWPDGRVVSNKLKLEFDSREEFACTMLAHSERLARR